MKTQTDKRQKATYRDVTCPFCSLLCDDLVVENRDGKLKVINNGCQVAVSEFEKTPPASSPQIKGRKASLESAIEEAAKLLKRSRQPLLTGLGTDVSGMRAILQLAEKTGAIVDHMHGDGLSKNAMVLQDLGWIMTTMSEIRNRADLVIFAGTDAGNYPGFYSRVIDNRSTLFKTDLKNRELIYIGDKPDSKLARRPGGRKPAVMHCKPEHIGEIISVVHTMIVGDRIDADVIHGVKLQTLIDLAEKMKQAKYGVIVWAPGELNFPHAELTIQNFCEVIKYLTRTTRFAGFSLGGNDGGTTAVNVCAWQSGYPLRVSFAKGFPEYDPHIYTTANVLKNRRVDAMLWLSGISPGAVPPKADIPSVVLASTSVKIGYRPDVFIPIGTPGLDHKGHLFRTDSVVALPLKQLRQTEIHSASEVLTGILEHF